jgi:hypothetical protein
MLINEIPQWRSTEQFKKSPPQLNDCDALSVLTKERLSERLSNSMEEEPIQAPTDSTVEMSSGSEIGAHSAQMPVIPLKNIVVNTDSDTVGMVPISARVSREPASISARRDGPQTGRARRSECCLLL